MRILPFSRGALLCFLFSLLFVVRICDCSDKEVEVVGTGECADCTQNNLKTSLAFSGLRVAIDCKLESGEFKTRGIGELDEDGNFRVSLPKEIVHEDGKLKEECYAQLHSASATPCPSHDGIESSKIVFKTKNDVKHTFGLAGKLKFSSVTCASALFWPHFKYPPLPKWPSFQHPTFQLPPLTNYGQPIILPKNKKPFPLGPKVLPPKPPVITKPCPQVKKPLPPIAKVLPPPVPIDKPKPQVPKILPPPVPIYKPKPPVRKILPPPVPIYKPKPSVPKVVPIYKPKPPVPKVLPSPVPIYKSKPPVPKVIPPTVPIYKPKPSIPKVLPPLVPIYKPKPSIYIKPLPPHPKIPPFYKKPGPPLPNLPPIPEIPPKYFHHPKFGKWPPVAPFASHP